MLKLSRSVLATNTSPRFFSRSRYTTLHMYSTWWRPRAPFLCLHEHSCLVKFLQPFQHIGSGQAWSFWYRFIDKYMNNQCSNRGKERKRKDGDQKGGGVKRKLTLGMMLESHEDFCKTCVCIWSLFYLEGLFVCDLSIQIVSRQQVTL